MTRTSNKRKHNTRKRTQRTKKVVCCPICGQRCSEGAGLASHVRTCIPIEEYDQDIASNGNTDSDSDTRNVAKGGVNGGVNNVNDGHDIEVDSNINDKHDKEDDKHDKEEDEDIYLPNYSYGLEENDINEHNDYDDNHNEDYSDAFWWWCQCG